MPFWARPWSLWRSWSRTSTRSAGSAPWDWQAFPETFRRRWAAASAAPSTDRSSAKSQRRPAAAKRAARSATCRRLRGRAIAGAAAGASGDDDIKRTREATEGFKSQAQQINELVVVRDRLNKAVKESIEQDKKDASLNGKASAVTKDLQGRVVGVNERIAAAQKKGAGGGNEPQQVLDAQLQQKIKAAQDALTTERDQLAFSQRILQGVYSAGEISLKDFYDKSARPSSKALPRNRGIRERARGRRRAPREDAQDQPER
jgi:hypothetical protein